MKIRFSAKCITILLNLLVHKTFSTNRGVAMETSSASSSCTVSKLSSISMIRDDTDSFTSGTFSSLRVKVRGVTPSSEAWCLDRRIKYLEVHMNTYHMIHPLCRESQLMNFLIRNDTKHFLHQFCASLPVKSLADALFSHGIFSQQMLTSWMFIFSLSHQLSFFLVCYSINDLWDVCFKINELN